MKYPMREKYIDEILGIWTIFGTHSDGTVDIADQNKDIFTNLDRATAEYLIDLHDKFKLKVINRIGMK